MTPNILSNIKTLYTCKTPAQPSNADPIHDAALVWEGAQILWVGERAALPAEFQEIPPHHHHNAQGALVIPGLIDAHTHLAFGGWRAEEFGLRCKGATYQEIAAAGGGITRTARLTREATEDSLHALASERLAAMLRLGVTTVEAKSGYGLTVQDELKTLRAYARLQNHPVTVIPTVLAAHVVPPELRTQREVWLEQVESQLLPAVAHEKLAHFIDAFVEEGAFTVAEARRVFQAGAKYGLQPRLHADQLSDTGGGLLAAEVGAASADHLEYVSDASLEAMQRAGTTAITLPIATLYLRQPPLDARRCIRAGVPVVVATDFNPGSAPCWHLPWAMTLACITNRLSPAEALLGATHLAARSLRLMDRGYIGVKARADFAIINAPSLEHWLYQPTPNDCVATFAAGHLVSSLNPTELLWRTA